MGSIPLHARVLVAPPDRAVEHYSNKSILVAAMFHTIPVAPTSLMVVYALAHNSVGSASNPGLSTDVASNAEDRTCFNTILC